MLREEATFAWEEFRLRRTCDGLDAQHLVTMFAMHSSMLLYNNEECMIMNDDEMALHRY
jgi:hypothetical protein